MSALTHAQESIDWWIGTYILKHHEPFNPTTVEYRIDFLILTKPIEEELPNNKFQVPLPGGMSIYGCSQSNRKWKKPFAEYELKHAIENVLSIQFCITDELWIDVHRGAGLHHLICQEIAHKIISKVTETAFNSWRENAPRLVRKPTSAN